ncbi:MAG: HAMP domain-containing sensor histidine kinase [Bacilli bacterium]|nr:HAMP domain-containing sensor histidine kinase [Bacilli bacterium]
MKILKKSKLSSQLLWLIGIAFVLLFTSLGVILPKMLIPVAERNIYSYLSEPLKYVDSTVDNKLLSTEVAYIYIKDNRIIYSDNLEKVIQLTDPKKLISYIREDYGKFNYNHKTYYYYTFTNETLKKIAISNDNYINKTKAAILTVIFPIVLLTFLIIGMMLVLWSSLIVRKIQKLKEKIDNIDNPNYNHNIYFDSDDEMRSLSYAIEDMRKSLMHQEEYRNQMYQNISHDFKTPLTVIKSYIEACEDGVTSSEEALPVIKEQTEKLENKVRSLLYLNKLDYLKDTKVDLQQVDMNKIIQDEVEKFKYHNKNIKFIVETDKKSKYLGTVEHWETILDNLLSNSMRYTKTKIKITAKQNKIIVYNDGDNIDEALLSGIFTPFRKGIKGEFGLGLSIVKKTLNIMKYDISIRNEKVGVSFIITKESK